MPVAATLAALGGVARTGELRRHHTKRELTKACAAGDIVRVSHGRFTLPSTAGHLGLAHARTATLSHVSAALHYGWKVKTLPCSASMTFPRGRRLRAGQRVGIDPHWADLEQREVRDGVTSPVRTVLDCARTLPFDEALAIADSALRSRMVNRADLRRAADTVTGPGAARARRVALHANAKAANPLESVIRALAIEEGMDLTPQMQFAESGIFAVVDLGSEELRLVVEAEGYETHGTRSGLRRDCRRHSLFAVWGWDSLRFAYEDAMYEQEWVRWVFRSWRITHEGGIPSRPPRLAQAVAA
jgi:very-short-patch-repair endonuclease